jgi:guanylate kinase
LSKKKKKAPKRRQAKRREKLARRGLMFVLSSPSGAGKTTLTRKLLELDRNIRLSISVTTRTKRPGEREGVHYFFTTPDKFHAMREKGELLEWAEVFGSFYATPRAAVDKALKEGRDVLFDIDWQGTQQLREGEARGDLVSVFILPPSAPELKRRLHTRAQDSEATIKKRMAMAADEISHWAEYDYVLVNDDFDACLGELQAILAAERLKRERRTGLSGFVRGLQERL